MHSLAPPASLMTRRCAVIFLGVLRRKSHLKLKNFDCSPVSGERREAFAQMISCNAIHLVSDQIGSGPLLLQILTPGQDWRSA
jgi:hypothetical protein